MTQEPSRPASADGEDVEQFSVHVEERDGGWAVVKTADGESTVVDTYSEEQDARRLADSLDRAANRYDGAPRVEDVPGSYPGQSDTNA